LCCFKFDLGREFFVKRSIIPLTKLVLGIEFLNVPFTENYVMLNDNNCAPPESLVYSWGTVVNNPRMADVLFQVQGEILCANKEIVCGRSEYFNAMFASGYVESRMISVAECGRLRKRLRDSAGKSIERNMEGQDIESLDKIKQIEIKDEEQRVTKKQRSAHIENESSIYTASSISPNHVVNNSKDYRNDSSKKIDNIQIDDNDNGKVNNRNDHEIPESIVKSKIGTQEDIIRKQVTQDDRIYSVIAKNSGPEAEVDEEFPQDLPPGFYHVVNITDCDVPTFYALLHYLYTNEIVLSEPVGTSKVTSLVYLFRLADKYQITDLRQRTLARIYKELAISNVAEVLFSLGHQWLDLKKVCMDYILKHFATVRETEGFNKVMENPENYTGFSEIAKDLFKKLKIADERE
jgi:hypothetical protein